MRGPGFFFLAQLRYRRLSKNPMSLQGIGHMTWHEVVPFAEPNVPESIPVSRKERKEPERK
jgi:hypothetical protein